MKVSLVRLKFEPRDVWVGVYWTNSYMDEIGAYVEIIEAALLTKENRQ